MMNQEAGLIVKMPWQTLKGEGTQTDSKINKEDMQFVESFEADIWPIKTAEPLHISLKSSG